MITFYCDYFYFSSILLVKQFLGFAARFTGQNGPAIPMPTRRFDIAGPFLVLRLFVFDFIYFHHMYLGGQTRCPVFSIKKKILQSGNNPLRKLKATTVTRFWIVLTIVFTSWSLAAAAGVPAGKPQIQGGNRAH